MADLRQAAPALTPEVLLARVSAYLGDLARDVRNVEQVVGVSTDAPAAPAAIIQVQSLDRLHQSLEDLACLADGLARIERAGWAGLEGLVGVRRNLRLEATRALLDSPGGATMARRNPSGDVDLF